MMFGGAEIYEAPHRVVFSSLLFPTSSWVQIFPSAVCSQQVLHSETHSP